jgi:hypothetical protein
VAVASREVAHGALADVTRVQFATPDAALAPSLLALQQQLDQWLDQRLAAAARPADPIADPLPCVAGECKQYRAGCWVIRNDGEFLSARCFAAPVLYAKYVAEKSFNARRIGNAFVLQSAQQLLARAPAPVDEALQQRCPGNDTPLDWWSLQATDLQLHFESYHPSGGNCWLPLATLRDWLGCSTLYAPVDVDGSSTDAPNAPLSFVTGAPSGQNPYSDMLYVWTAYAARAPLATRIRQELQRFSATVASKDEEPVSNCSVALSTEAIFSAVCSGSGDVSLALSYRLGDGSKIRAKDVLRAPQLPAKLAKKCLGPFVTSSAGDTRLLARLPALQESDFENFVLRQNGVTFLVPVTFEGQAAPTSEGCFVPFQELGTNLYQLGRPPP